MGPDDPKFLRELSALYAEIRHAAVASLRGEQETRAFQWASGFLLNKAEKLEQRAPEIITSKEPTRTSAHAQTDGGELFNLIMSADLAWLRLTSAPRAHALGRPPRKTQERLGGSGTARTARRIEWLEWGKDRLETENGRLWEAALEPFETSRLAGIRKIIRSVRDGGKSHDEFLTER